MIRRVRELSRATKTLYDNEAEGCPAVGLSACRTVARPSLRRPQGYRQPIAVCAAVLQLIWMAR